MTDKNFKVFDVLCSQTLSRSYKVVSDSEDVSEVSWFNEYKDNGFHTPLELIDILKIILKTYLRQDHPLYGDSQLTQKIIEECEGWEEDETVIEQE